MFSMRIGRSVFPVFLLALAVCGCRSSQPVAGLSSSTAKSGSGTIAGANPQAGGPVPGPLAAGPYVSCASVAHSVEVSDPVGDLEILDHLQLAKQFRSVDLTMVRVAVDGTRLCVDFTAEAPPTPRTFYIFRLVGGGSLVGIDLIFWPNGARQVALKYPGDEESPNRGIVPAQVGIAENSTSLVIDRRVLPRFAPFRRFSWNAEGVGQTGLAAQQQVTDTDPNGRDYATYP